MAAGATRNLFIQIGGSASDLTTAAKAARSAIAGIGDSADDVQSAFRTAFEKMGGTVQDQAKAMEQAYGRSIANIKATAQAALRAPAGSQGLMINLSGARQEATQLQASAEFYRRLADAQAEQVNSGAEVSAKARQAAIALEAMAVAEENAALAAKETVVGLQRLAAASGIAVNDLDEVAGAHTRMGASGMIAEHVVRSFSDSITAGQSPIRAFALEIPRITEALQFFAIETKATEGAVASFAEFMSGPLGLAITLGTSLLAPLIANFFETKDAAHDAATAEKDYAKSQDDFADAIDKANGKLRDRNQLLAAIALQEKGPEIEKQQANAKSFSDQAFAAASSGAVVGHEFTAERQSSAPIYDPQILKAITSANGDVVKLRNNLDALAKGASGDNKTALRSLADEVNHLAGQSVNAAKQAEALKGAAAATATVLGHGTIRTTESVQRSVEEKNATTPLEKAQIRLREINDQKADLDKMPYGPAQQAALKKWGDELDAATAAVKRLQAAQRDERGGRQVGRQINLSQAEDIVRGIGGTITSSYRSTAQQQVLYDRYRAGTGSLAARPGTSEHERGEALDVAKTAGVSMASLKKAFEDAGVHLTEALDEGNHYHVAWGPKGPSADAMARREQVADTKAANRDGSFQSALKSALDGLSEAQGRQPQTPDEEYQNTSRKLEDDFIQQDAALQDKVDAGKLTAAEALQIEAILNATRLLNEESAKRKQLASALDQQIRVEDASIEAQNGLLQARLGVTDGREAQKGIAEQILANKQKKEADDLGAILNPNSGATAEQRQEALARSMALPDQQAAEREALNRQYASPGQKYLQGLDGTSISDQLDQVKVDGLGHLEDGLEGVLEGTKSVKAAFSDMARSIVDDLIKIAIEQALIKPLAKSLFGGGGGGFLSALFGGGGAAFSASSAPLVSNVAMVATGGHITGPGTGTSDSILARLSNGEFVVNAAATKRSLPLLHAINDNRFPAFADGGLIGDIAMPTLGYRELREISRPQGQQQVVLHVQANDYFDAKVASISGSQIQHAAPHIAAGGAQLAEMKARRAQRRQLGTR